MLVCRKWDQKIKLLPFAVEAFFNRKKREQTAGIVEDVRLSLCYSDESLIVKSGHNACRKVAKTIFWRRRKRGMHQHVESAYTRKEKVLET